MWVQRSNKSFTNYALRYIENPLFMVVTGSRMYGFHDEDSDWDVYAVFAMPSVRLFGIQKPEMTFTTPQIMLYNKLVSVKVEEVEQVFRRIMDGDMKTFERIFSPLVIMKTDHLGSIRSIAKKFINHATIESYLEYVDECIKQYNESSNVKYLLYALRASLTANLVVKSNIFVMKLQDLYAMFPNSQLRSLVLAKQGRGVFDAVDAAMAEIQAVVEETRTLLPRFRPGGKKGKTRLKEIEQYLLSIRLQHMFSRKMGIHLRELES